MTTRDSRRRGADDAPEPADERPRSRSRCARAPGAGRRRRSAVGADDETAAAEDRPEPEPHRPALVWTPTSPFDDSEVRNDLDDFDDPDDPDDPDFFRRLAAEIREDARGDDHFAASYGVPESAPSTVAPRRPTAMTRR
jgi:hypothetical protein